MKSGSCSQPSRSPGSGGTAPGPSLSTSRAAGAEACQGAGYVEIEMIFMADVYIECDACRGTRYRSELLDVRFKGRNVAQVLDITVDEAIRFFIRQDRLGRDSVAASAGRARIPKARTARPDPIRRGGPTAQDRSGVGRRVREEGA